MWRKGEEEQAEAIRKRIRAVRPETCSGLIRCPNCDQILRKPDDFYSPKNIDSFERRSCIPDTMGLDTLYVHCYYCGCSLEKLNVFEGRYDTIHSALTRRQRRRLATEEDFCIRCDRNRRMEPGSSGRCRGDRLHELVRGSGFSFADLLNARKLGYRLRPRWIPEDWPAHVSGNLSFYLRTPNEWYTGGFSRHGFSFTATEQETGLQFNIVSLNTSDEVSSPEDYLTSLMEDPGKDHPEVKTKARRHLRLSGTGDTIWPRYHRERPMLDFEPGRRSLWIRMSFRSDKLMVREVFVMQRDEHLLAAWFTYPDASRRRVKPLVRRCAGTIRLASTSFCDVH